MMSSNNQALDEERARGASKDNGKKPPATTTSETDTFHHMAALSQDCEQAADASIEASIDQKVAAKRREKPEHSRTKEQQRREFEAEQDVNRKPAALKRPWYRPFAKLENSDVRDGSDAQSHAEVSNETTADDSSSSVNVSKGALPQNPEASSDDLPSVAQTCTTEATGDDSQDSKPAALKRPWYRPFAKKYDNGDDEEDDAVPTLSLDSGDHIVRWTHVLLYPVQQHGIVLAARPGLLSILNCGTHRHDPKRVAHAIETIETTNGADHGDGSEEQSVHQQSTTKPVVKRVHVLSLTDEKEIGAWKKVEYGMVRRRRKKSPQLPKSDPTGLVLSRVKFLLEQQDKEEKEADANARILPKPHPLYSNSECIAVWCKTGRFATLQAAVFLHATALGQAKTAATVAMICGTSTVTVTTTAPAGGVLGWFGFTTTTTAQVGLLSAQPWLIPVLIGYGVAAVSAPYVVLRHCQGKWSDATRALNDAFWSMAEPEVFVDVIRNWSGLQ